MSGKTNRLLVKAVRTKRRATLQLRLGSRLHCVGDQVVVGPGLFASRNSILSIGNRVGIGPHFTLMADLHLGDDVMVSGNVSVIGNDHPFDESSKTFNEFSARPPARVRIIGDNLLGFGSTIVGPVTIGQGAVVGAGSLVTTDVPANAVVVGIPARILRYRRDTEESKRS